MHKPRLIGLALALLASPAFAQVPQPPQPTHVAPGTGGTSPPRSHEAPVVGLQANEVRASQLKNATVMSSDGQKLGLIGDLLLDRQRHAIDLVGLQTTRTPGKSTIIIPWSSLQPARNPGEGFVSPLSPQAVASARSFADAVKAHPDYIDVEHDTLGRQVVGRDGKHRGTIVDLIFERQSGAIDYVLIDEGFGLGTGNEAQAVPWSAVAKFPKQHDQPVALTLDHQQFAEAPFFGLKAPVRPQDVNPQKTFEMDGNVPANGSSQPGH